MYLGHVADTDLGPVISPESKERICRLVHSGIDEGAKCILDGRDILVPGFEKGNFVGPTILTDVKVFCFRKLSKYVFLRIYMIYSPIWSATVKKSLAQFCW